METKTTNIAELKVVPEKQDTIKVTRGQRGGVGWEFEIHGDITTETGRIEILDAIKKTKEKLEALVGSTVEGEK